MPNLRLWDSSQHIGKNRSWEASQLPGGLRAQAQSAEVALARTPE